MKRIVYLTLACVAILSSCGPKSDPGKEEWIQLFNGKDLDGWDIKITHHPINKNLNNTFRVENGVLKISYDQYKEFGENFGHLYYKQPFSYYRLKAEYRFYGEQLKGGADWNVRNSGIMFHSQPAASLSIDQAFPVSLEIQLLGGLSDGKPRTTANLCTPGTMVEMNGTLNPSHCISSSSKTYDGDQWVSVEAMVLGDSLIQHIMDKKVILEYAKPRVGEFEGDSLRKAYFLNGWGYEHNGMALKEGTIALQAESHGIEFRKVELLNLKGCMNPKCEKYRSYFVVAGECDCHE